MFFSSKSVKCKKSPKKVGFFWTPKSIRIHFSHQRCDLTSIFNVKSRVTQTQNFSQNYQFLRAKKLNLESQERSRVQTAVIFLQRYTSSWAVFHRKSWCRGYACFGWQFLERAKISQKSRILRFKKWNLETQKKVWWKTDSVSDSSMGRSESTSDGICVVNCSKTLVLFLSFVVSQNNRKNHQFCALKTLISQT